MKLHFNLLSTLALAGSLALGFNSCSDNDLDASNGGSNGNGDITSEQMADKYYSLQRLLSAVAEVDSLPDNWNSDSFTAEPTLGTAQSEGNSFVRLVVTNSAEDADRDYRLMTGETITGKATDGEWKKDGIGSLKFKVQNQPDLYATIDVDVKQLPHLTQIRFVPASAVGNNGWFSKPKEVFYQFGDIIRQEIDGRTTLWVCVRPCNASGTLGKSHWCTLQKVPLDSKNANYVKINTDLVLPTKLGSAESDGQKMVQNYFNVLRAIAAPETYTTVKGIDKISNTEFLYDDLRAISYLWQSNKYFSAIGMGSLQNTLSDVGDDNDKNDAGEYDGEVEDGEGKIGVYYYGYSKKFFGKGNYNLYEVLLSKSADGSLYDVATPIKPWVNKDTEADFRDDGDNQISVTLPSDDKDNRTEYTYVVKHRTGAELEGSWGNDADPETSFTLRLNNNIQDVLVSRDVVDQTAKQTGKPFFAFFDKVQLTKDFNGPQYCMLDAGYTCSNVSGGTTTYAYNLDGAAGKAFFLCSNNNSSLVEGATNKGIKVSSKMASVILFHVMNSYYAYWKNKTSNLPFRSLYTEAYLSVIEDLLKTEDELHHANFTYFVKRDPDDNTDDTYNPRQDGTIDFDIEAHDGCVKVKAAFNSGTYELKYDEDTKKYSFQTLNEKDDRLKQLRVYSYEDSQTYKETYSTKRQINLKGENRDKARQMAEGVNLFLQNCEYAN